MWFPDGVSLTAPEPSTRSAAHRGGRRSLPGRGPIALVLLVLGVGLFCLYLVFNGSEHHSYNAGAKPAQNVQVTGGKVYEISTPGGVVGLQHRGLDPNSIACTYSTSQVASSSLSISSLGGGTRTTHAVATFVAPVSGDISISCTELSSGVFVDDADNAPSDPSGLFLLLATIALGVGAPIGMSYLYSRSLGRPRQDDQVEAVVEPPFVPDEGGYTDVSNEFG